MKGRHRVLLQRELFWKAHRAETQPPAGKVQALVKSSNPATILTKAAGPTTHRDPAVTGSQPVGCEVPQICFLQVEVPGPKSFSYIR